MGQLIPILSYFTLSLVPLHSAISKMRPISISRQEGRADRWRQSAHSHFLVMSFDSATFCSLLKDEERAKRSQLASSPSLFFAAAFFAAGEGRKADNDALQFPLCFPSLSVPSLPGKRRLRKRKRANSYKLGNFPLFPLPPFLLGGFLPLLLIPFPFLKGRKGSGAGDEAERRKRRRRRIA